MTTGDDAKMLLRGWRGNDPIFELMDTPGLLDSGGSKVDGANIKAIVTRLQQRKLNSFMFMWMPFHEKLSLYPKALKKLC